MNDGIITKNDRQGNIELDKIEMNRNSPVEFEHQLKDLLNEYRMVCDNTYEQISVTDRMSYKIQMKTPDLVINIYSLIKFMT